MSNPFQSEKAIEAHYYAPALNPESAHSQITGANLTLSRNQIEEDASVPVHQKKIAHANVHMFTLYNNPEIFKRLRHTLPENLQAEEVFSFERRLKPAEVKPLSTLSIQRAIHDTSWEDIALRIPSRTGYSDIFDFTQIREDLSIYASCKGIKDATSAEYLDRAEAFAHGFCLKMETILAKSGNPGYVVFIEQGQSLVPLKESSRVACRLYNAFIRTVVAHFEAKTVICLGGIYMEAQQA